jgi:hypothetical protein
VDAMRREWRPDVGTALHRAEVAMEKKAENTRKAKKFSMTEQGTHWELSDTSSRFMNTSENGTEI